MECVSTFARMLVRLRWLVVLCLTVLLVGCADAAAPDVGSSAAGATDTTAARTAATDLSDATEKKEAVDVRLGRAIGRAGGLLTAQQQADFVRAFNELPDVQTIERNYRQKARNLATELDRVKADPEAITTYGARNLLDGYAALAKTPEALAALKLAVDVLSRRVVLPGVKDVEVIEKVLAPSLPGGYLQHLIETGSEEEAKTRTVEILETGADIAVRVAGWLRSYDAFNDGDVLARTFGITNDATLGSLRTIAGVIAIWKLGDDIARGRADQLVQDFFASAPTAVTGVAAATALFRRVVMGIEETPLATSVIKWSGKIVVGVGAVTSALALWHDSGKWDESLDGKVRVMSDVLAIGASILVLAGTGPVGPIVATVAVGLSFFADWLEGRRLAAEEQADVAACLPKTGLGPMLVMTILASEPALLRELVEEVKLGPSDLQWLLTVDPSVATADAGPPVQALGILIAQKVFDLDPAETAALLRAALGMETRPKESEIRLDAFLRALSFGGLRGDMTRAEALDWFQNDAVSSGMQEPRRSLAFAAMNGARTYLASVN